MSTRLLGIAAVLLLIGMAVYLQPLDPSIVALQITFSAASFAEVFGHWSGPAQARFHTHFLVDYPFIAIYSAWGFLQARHSNAMAWYGPRSRRLVAWLLPVAGAADVLENVLHQTITAGPLLSMSPSVYPIAGCAASLKWVAAVAFAGLASVAWLARGRSA